MNRGRLFGRSVKPELEKDSDINLTCPDLRGLTGLCGHIDLWNDPKTKIKIWNSILSKFYRQPTQR